MSSAPALPAVCPNSKRLPTPISRNAPTAFTFRASATTPSSAKHPRFIRGYGFQGGADSDFNLNAEGYGTTFKKAVKEGVYGINLGAFGESLARWDNFIEIDPVSKTPGAFPLCAST